eukprot:Gb_41374 [translate_table: standard]
MEMEVEGRLVTRRWSHKSHLLGRSRFSSAISHSSLGISALCEKAYGYEYPIMVHPQPKRFAAGHAGRSNIPRKCLLSLLSAACNCKRRLITSRRDVPKGCVAVRVGKGEEQSRRLVIPLSYLNHPVFITLLEDAADVYGFDQKGIIRIPCSLQEFLEAKQLIVSTTSFFVSPSTCSMF